MSTPHFNFFKEKMILQEEEKQLKKMLEKFQDQQNRLKIEELALITMSKMEQEKLSRGEKAQNSNASSWTAGSECSTSMSSITSKEMTNYIPVGTVISEDASMINKETLDLNVGRNMHRIGVDFNTVEEEDSDDFEEDERVNARVDAESYQLMSFMDDF